MLVLTRKLMEKLGLSSRAEIIKYAANAFLARMFRIHASLVWRNNRLTADVFETPRPHAWSGRLKAVAFRQSRSQ